MDGARRFRGRIHRPVHFLSGGTGVKFEKLLKLWDLAEMYLVGTLAIFATVIAFCQIIMRYFFNFSPEWIEESIIYVIVWAVFIMASKLVRDDQHVGADFIFQKFPPRFQRKVAIVTTGLALIFCLIIVFYGMQVVSVAIGMDERSTTRMRFPLWIAYLSVPTGCFLVSLSLIYRAYLLIAKFDAEMFIKKGHEDKRAKVT
ncbi:MAG: TRAP transporter small permease [Deltaproteobacteria bacterium]|nr:TRAP transporter small permease [Deltaproteobacteria bacterium]